MSVRFQTLETWREVIREVKFLARIGKQPCEEARWPSGLIAHKLYPRAHTHSETLNQTSFSCASCWNGLAASDRYRNNLCVSRGSEKPRKSINRLSSILSSSSSSSSLSRPKAKRKISRSAGRVPPRRFTREFASPERETNDGRSHQIRIYHTQPWRERD